MADIARIIEVVEPEARALGFDLVRVRYFKGGEIGPLSDAEEFTLQIMAERPETGQLVIEDCAALSHRISDALDALVLVREGAPLASAIGGKKRFPGLVAMFARLGEQTGQLPVMLDRAAKQLGEEVQRRAMQFATLLEPLLIVGMGLVVMLIVLAVLMPIIELNQLVK